MCFEKHRCSKCRRCGWVLTCSIRMSCLLDTDPRHIYRDSILLTMHLLQSSPTKGHHVDHLKQQSTGCPSEMDPPRGDPADGQAHVRKVEFNVREEDRIKIEVSLNTSNQINLTIILNMLITDPIRGGRAARLCDHSEQSSCTGQRSCHPKNETGSDSTCFAATEW